MNCAVCLDKYTTDTKKKAHVLPCGHTFCAECIAKFKLCPSCRSPFSEQPSPNYAVNEIISGGEFASEDPTSASSLHNNALIDAGDVSTGPIISSGLLSETFGGTWSGIEVALKEFRVPGDAATKVKLIKCLTCHKLRHPRLCTVYGYTSRGTEHHIVAVEELAISNASRMFENDLLDSFNEADSTLILKDIANALNYLHAACEPHGSIKPSNVLLFKDCAKLSDYGLWSLRQAWASSLGYDHRLLAPAYLAPELLSATQPPTRDALLKADVYAFGVLVYELMSGKRAFDDSSPLAIVSELLQGKTGSGFSAPITNKELSELSCQCRNVDPASRPTAADVCKTLIAVCASCTVKPAYFSATDKTAAAYSEYLSYPTVTIPMIDHRRLACVTRPGVCPKKYAQFKHGQMYKDDKGGHALCMGFGAVEKEYLFFCDRKTGSGVYDDDDLEKLTLTSDCEAPGPLQFYYATADGFKRVLLTIDLEAFKRLGLSQGDRLRTPGGSAVVLGFDELKRLHIHYKNSKGSSAILVRNKEDLAAQGLTVYDTPAPPVPESGPILVPYPTREGRWLTMDVSAKALASLGYPHMRHGALYKDSQGSPVLVVGVADNKAWFHVLASNTSSGAAGAGIYGRDTEDDLLDHVLHDPVPPPTDNPPAGCAFYPVSSGNRILLDIDEERNMARFGRKMKDRLNMGDDSTIYVGFNPEDGYAYGWSLGSKYVSQVTRSAEELSGYSLVKRARRAENLSEEVARAIVAHGRTACYYDKTHEVSSFFIDNEVIQLYGGYKHGKLFLDNNGDRVLCFGVKMHDGNHELWFHDASNCGIGRYSGDINELMFNWKLLSEPEIPEGHAAYLHKDDVMTVDIRQEVISQYDPAAKNGLLCEKDDKAYMVAGVRDDKLFYYSPDEKCLVSFDKKTLAENGLKILTDEQVTARRNRHRRRRRRSSDEVPSLRDLPELPECPTQ